MSDTEALRNRIAEELERQRSDIIGSPSLSVGLVVTREINHAIGHYDGVRFRWNERPNDEFTTLVAGQRLYSLPSDFVKMDTLKVVDNDAFIPLLSRTWEELEEKDREVDDTEGTPFEYSIYGNLLRVYPIPDDTLTLVGSYLYRTRPTSLTGSYCAVITMGGGSLTATSTASHNNRLDGWTTDGEELIRARAVASVEINYLKNANTITEMRQLAAQRLPYLSIREKLAFARVSDEASNMLRGFIRPYEI